MTDKKSNDSRRKLLKSIAAGSGAVVAGKSLPESWTKPAIDSVILPTHANISEDAGSGYRGGDGGNGGSGTDNHQGSGTGAGGNGGAGRVAPPNGNGENGQIGVDGQVTLQFCVK